MYYVKPDMEEDIKIFYYKKNNMNNWRFIIVKMGHLVPIVWILLEMLMNKIRIPWHHFLYSVALTGFYLFASYLSQVFNADYAVY